MSIELARMYVNEFVGLSREEQDDYLLTLADSDLTILQALLETSRLRDPGLRVKLLCPGAKAPTRGSAEAAGYDLYAIEDVVLPPYEIVKVRTGIATAFAPGFVALIRDRSGLGSKGITTATWGIIGGDEHVFGGVIDSDYRGEWVVMLMNLVEGEPYQIHAGDRIAQFVLLPIPIIESKGSVTIVDDLGNTDRGTNGLGSTGR